MTKTQMIEKLKMREATAWVKLQEHKDYCISRNRVDNKQFWSPNQIEMYDRYLHEWVESHACLKELEITPYTYFERKTLFNN